MMKIKNLRTKMNQIMMKLIQKKKKKKRKKKEKIPIKEIKKVKVVFQKERDMNKIAMMNI